MTISIHHLPGTFAVLKPDLAVQPVAVTPTLYRELDTAFQGFRGHVLVSSHEFTADWPTWERHPAGDEIVVLLSGRATMLLRTGAGEEALDLAAAASYVIVPRATWHTAKVSEPTRMLFITPGEGTENRAQP